MALAMGGGGGGGSVGSPGTIASPPADPANCGGLVCFAKPRVAPAAPGHRSHRRSKSFKHASDLYRRP